VIPDGFTVVAGSLGDQGGAVARTLKRHGRHVRALTHNRWSPAADELLQMGVEVLNDNIETPEVVVRDIAGAAHVFGAFTPFDEGGLRTELLQVRNLAWASVRAGVEHLVYSSVGDPEQDKEVAAGDLWGVERLLQQFDLPLTILRPAFFMENVDEFALRRDAGGSLVLRMPLSENTTVHWIAMEDVATSSTAIQCTLVCSLSGIFSTRAPSASRRSANSSTFSMKNAGLRIVSGRSNCRSNCSTPQESSAWTSLSCSGSPTAE
jgi:uncharacterized protein YbjT (DUF2867 family)